MRAVVGGVVKVMGTSARVGLDHHQKWGNSVGKGSSLHLPPESGGRLGFMLGFHHFSDQSALSDNSTKGMCQARMKWLEMTGGWEFRGLQCRGRVYVIVYVSVGEGAKPSSQRGRSISTEGGS